MNQEPEQSHDAAARAESLGVALMRTATLEIIWWVGLVTAIIGIVLRVSDTVASLELAHSGLILLTLSLAAPRSKK